MSETAVLESSAIEVPPPAMEIERGPLVMLSHEQRKEYSKTGILPSSEDSAPSPDKIGDSGTPMQQEKSKTEPKAKQTAEERIAQLEATIEKIRKGSGAETKPKAESAPAKPEPQLGDKPTPDDKNADGTPKYKTHAEYEDAALDWKFEQREAAKAATAAEAARLEALNAKVEKARARHGDIDAVIQSVANDIYQDQSISPIVKTMIGDSDYIADLIYTIGSDKAELAKFKAMSPRKAIEYIVVTEKLIAQELEEKETVVAEPPAKLKTQAPKPPAEAGGRAATPPDALQSALEGSAGKLNAGLKAEFLRRDLARMK